MSKKILVVDDSSSVRQIVSMTLKSKGYQVVMAEDGLDALSKLDGGGISLVVSDVNMPNMDGLTFVKTMKEQPQYQFTPVLMLTTEAQPEMKAKGKEIGVKAWLVKPFRPDVLLSAVSKLT